MKKFIFRLRAAASLIAAHEPAHQRMMAIANEMEKEMRDALENDPWKKTRQSIVRCVELWDEACKLHVEVHGRPLYRG